MASGAVSQVVRLLGEDLHFHPDDASAPYTALNQSGAEAHRHFCDFPSDTLDKHIHTSDHPSNILGASGIKVSTDSENGTPDSYLIPTGEFSDEGDQFHIGIKVIDLGALLCLNTGGYDYVRGSADPAVLIRTPALIDLKSWLPTKYNAVHSQRSGDGSKSLTVYDIECGRRLLSPIEGQKYLPFAIADEIYLRWLGAGRKASFGRVFDTLDGISDAKRMMLTTASSSRSITRSPATKVIASRFDLSETTALDSDDKDGLYTQLVLVAGSDDGKGGGLVQGTTIAMKNDAFPGFYGTADWRPTTMSTSYSSKNKRCQDPSKRAAWVFTSLPQATYRVWATWGTNATKPPAATVPYLVYTGGSIVSFKYAGGDLQRTFVANQTARPGTTINGQQWQSLGSYTTSGTLAVEIHGPQGVPEGESQFAFADAVMIESVSLDLGSGSKPAAHLTANTWAAMTDDVENKGKAFPFRPAGKDFTVFGVREQPFITEAFATHTTRTVTQGSEGGAVATIDENSWRWGVAVELMNFTDKVIDLKDYKFTLGNALSKDTVLHSFPAGSTIPKATAANGGRLVVYNFGSGDPALTGADVFGATFAATWKKVDGLNFDNTTIRLVQVAQKKGGGTTYRIPIDHINTGDGEDLLEYTALTTDVKVEAPPAAQAGKSVNKTTSASCRRDDSVTRKRYAVAKYWKPDKPIEIETVAASGAKPPCAITANDHKLGSDNGIGIAQLAESKVKEGFRMKLPYGLLEGPGAMSELYLVGPIIQHDAEGDDPSTTKPPSDLPQLLAQEYAISESRGRANSRLTNSHPFDDANLWNKYPRNRGGKTIAWPLLMGEIVETVPTDRQRGDSPGRVYGKLNVNTATSEVLQKLPWPDGVSGVTAAGQIIAYRKANNGFVTPGEVALALSDSATNKEMDRDAIYAAISSSISVSSDIYAVNIKVQLGNNPNEQDRAWYYMAVVDRGGAVFSTDKPAVLLFTQLK
jgi:hypothetical protein